MTLTTSPSVAVEFLERAFEPEDWVAVFLKAYDTGRVLQRVGPVSQWTDSRWQLWLRVMNAHRFNVYASVNGMTPGQKRRTKDCVSAVRQLFLDIDHDGPAVLNRLLSRPDVPVPSSLIRSSRGRWQVLWRVRAIPADVAEAIQKRLAVEFRTDLAATAISQTMRLPGFANHKYTPPEVVTVEYGSEAVFQASDFPGPGPIDDARHVLVPPSDIVLLPRPSVIDRARRYLAAVPPAVAGEGGDAATFRVCCRLVRGFALGAEDALSVLRDWNERCHPPWTDGELLAKLEHARRYGKEPVGGLLP